MSSRDANGAEARLESKPGMAKAREKGGEKAGQTCKRNSYGKHGGGVSRNGNGIAWTKEQA